MNGNKNTEGILDNDAEVIAVKRALDAYTNPAANLGVGSKNLSQAGGYILERFTWDYQTLSALFRNNWIAKAIIEKPANEMLKSGFQIQSELDPDKIDKVLNVWEYKAKEKFLEALKWARLYGGCLLIPVIEGQDDLSKPLDYDSIGVNSFKSCLVVDRWCGISPSLEIEKEIDDPEFGEPEFYTITSTAINKTVKVHHSRVIKLIGRKLPYWEEIAEDYWGASELEHIFTELKKRDDTSANIAFLIFLANIRVFSMEGLGQSITLGDQKAQQNVYETMRRMNELMCNTGTFAIDKEDSFSTQQYSFTGINDVYESFMLDISGAAEIPIDKLFGRSPSGFNSGAETLQNYYDTIQEKQETYIKRPLLKLLKIIIMSECGKIPDDIDFVFNPIRRPSDMEKADLGSKNTQVILDAFQAGIIGKAIALKELRQLSDISGVWTCITDNMIEEAEKEDEEREKNEKDEQKELESAMEEAINDNEENQEDNNRGSSKKSSKDSRLFSKLLHSKN